MGSDARRGKLTLFDAEGPREQGAFAHVGAARLRPRGGPRAAAGRDSRGLRRGRAASGSRSSRRRPTSSTTSITSRSSRATPQATAQEYLRYGFEPAGPGARRGRRRVRRVPRRATPGEPERPLLNHLAVLVDSADEVVADAKDLGIEVESVVDAANTFAAFLWGPERVRIEYVEHKPTFSLT